MAKIYNRKELMELASKITSDEGICIVCKEIYNLKGDDRGICFCDRDD